MWRIIVQESNIIEKERQGEKEEARHTAERGRDQAKK